MKTTLKTLILNCLLASCFITVHGQDFYASQRASWLQKAKESIPQLTVTEKKPVGLV
ncbi:MAG TPA: glycoside hydrolase, partial [Parabacteroides goldsteinii]|nr:glycoside hydrolase [Parabacteroides goldsteinii]